MTRLATAAACAASIVLGSLLLAGCARAPQPKTHSAATGPSSPRTATSATGPAPCAQWTCGADAPVQLGAGYSIRLWSSAPPSPAASGNLSSTPVLELLRDGQHTQWWVADLGYGWAATMTCLTTGPEPNCVVVSQQGAHAGAAEMVLLRSASLVGPARTRIVFDSGTPFAADLNGDGYLDLIGSNSDYQPNYANGHNFWVTYRFSRDSMIETGCVRLASRSEPRPNHLLSGPCPAPPPGPGPRRS